MQNIGTEYRDKIFDHEVLNFTLNLFDFIQQMPDQPELMRRVVLDAMTFNSSLSEVSLFLKSINALPLKEFSPHMESFLDICAQIGSQKDSTEEFLKTIRHISERKSFFCWEEFFAAIRILGAHSSALNDYLATVRALVSYPNFESWTDFVDGVRLIGLQAEILHSFFMTIRHSIERSDFVNWTEVVDGVRIISGEQNLLPEYFMTVRHLLSDRSFNSWQDLAASIKIGAGHDTVLSNLLMALRHITAVSRFAAWESFFVAHRMLASAGAEKQIYFLTAVRHVINYFQSPDALKSIFRTLASSPEYHEACAYGQLDSKQWLIEEALKVFGKDWGRVFVLAGWVGYLPRMIFDAGIQVSGVRSFDLDPKVAAVAESLNQSFVQKEWIFKASTKDITQMSYPAQFTVHRKDGSAVDLFEMPELIINTSCEHIEDIGSWLHQIPSGMRLIVQSNDAFHIQEHVKCFKTLAEFEAAMNLSEVYYRGEKRLADFNRFMLIGRR